MKTSLTFWNTVVALGLVITAPPTRSEVVSTPPAGYVKVEIAGRTVNFVSAPLRKRGAFTGRIVDIGPDSISFSQPGWSTNEFAAATDGKPRYYLEMVTGSLTGLYFPIVANTADTLTLDVGERDLTTVFNGLGSLQKDLNPSGGGLETRGDMARIRPAWTVREVFGDEEGILETFPDATAAAPMNGGDRIFVPDNETPGVQKFPAKSLSYIDELGWRDIADLNTEQGDTALLPGDPLIVHRNAADGAEMLFVGYPKLERSVQWVPGRTEQGADLTFVANVFSEPISLDESGLTGLGNEVVEASLSLAQNGDEVFLYNQSRGGPIPMPDQRFVNVLGQGWRERGSASTTVGAIETLLPGRGFGILKASGTSGRYWISLPEYLSEE